MTLIIMDLNDPPDDDKAVSLQCRRLFVSPQEAADLMGSSRGYVYSLLNKGHLKSLKLEGRRMIPTTEIDRLTQLAEFEHDQQPE
jgi:excisionase family DNA binding protein